MTTSFGPVLTRVDELGADINSYNLWEWSVQDQLHYAISGNASSPTPLRLHSNDGSNTVDRGLITGPITTSHAIYSMSINSDTNTAYLFGAINNLFEFGIWSLDLDTRITVLVKNFGSLITTAAYNGYGIASSFNADNSILYALCGDDPGANKTWLVAIDPITYVATEIGELGTNRTLTTYTGLAFLDGVLYAFYAPVQVSGGSLETVNILTGAVTSLGAVSYPEDSGDSRWRLTGLTSRIPA